MTTSTDSDIAADRALKEKHRALWALGDYAAVAAEVIAETGPALVGAVGVEAGDRVLDVAAGSGNASVPAAQAGGRVVASDLTPELFAAGRESAAEAGVEIAFEQGDAEALPYDDASYDVVVSCVGVMFAPHHERAAAELLRVTRPGGRIGLLSWTPAGFIGRMFATMKPYAPPPPPGAQPPPLWGDEAHVRGLLGDSVTGLQARTGRARVDRFADAEAFLTFFKENYGPTIAVYRFIADQPERVAELDAALIGLAEEHLDDGVMEWEYLLVTAERG
jgi:SAM-dependent methyltransferase